ncbi:MAG: hypothetical protein GWN58_54150, partial [Anaerolineae bacterium]|nr:hypothetical protein [Anaerolineae bacterium]
METSLLDIGGTLVAAILTLFVFSYLLGDNVLYRLAEHLFVGVAVGYGMVVVFHTVLSSKLMMPLVEALSNGDWGRVLMLGISLLMGLLLLTKPFKALSWLGSLSVAFLVGVGAALAISGAMLGTLLPQTDATANISYYVTRYGPVLGWFSGAVVLIGTIGVLIHFHFGSREQGPVAKLRTGVVR